MSSTRTITVARWVSIIGHPFLTALVLAWAIEAQRGAAAARTVVVVAALFVLPLALLTAWQVRRGAWHTVDASRPRDRPLLFGVGALALLAMLALFARSPAHALLATGTVAVLAMLVVCALVTPWLKVSLHMAAAGLAAAVLSMRGLPLGGLLAAMLPVLGWSRVALQRHRWSEVIAGAAIGLGTGVLVVLHG